jgi:hypothetical protein
MAIVVGHDSECIVTGKYACGNMEIAMICLPENQFAQELL